MILLVLLLASSGEGVARLLEQEADVFVDKAGLSRLPLPSEVLSAARPDLGDVRLYAGDKEIVYVIDSGDTVLGKRETVALKITSAKREEQRRDDGPTIYRESYELQGLQAGAFTFVIDSPRARFVRRVTIASPEGSAPVLDAVSFFRLPEMGASRTTMPVKVDASRRWVVRIEGEGDGYLEPRFSLVRDTQIGGGKDLELPLDDPKIMERDQKTVITVERPVGLVPSALLLSASTDIYDRPVRIYDESVVYGERLIGSGRVFRVAGFVAVEEATIAIGGARGERLRIEIEDGDSPALVGLSLRSIVRQPTLVFSAPKGGPEPAAVLRFGGGRANRPHYDVSSLVPPVGATVSGKRGEAAERLFRLDTMQPAHLSPLRKNPTFDTQPALAFAMRPGAAVDVRKFTHRKALTIAASREGLSRIVLGPEEQAVARADLGDVRLVDKQGKQWPYLLDARAAELWRPLVVEAPVAKEKHSRYVLKDEQAPMTVDGIDVTVGQGFVDRAFVVWAVDDKGNERELARGRLQKTADSRRPMAVHFAPARVHALVLDVDDRDDAPLEISEARARYMQAYLYAAAAPGPYFLFFGAPSEEHPTYELERARETILAVRANDAAIETLMPNPTYTMATKLDDNATTMELGLWLAIIAAVIVLGGLTFRLSRQDA